MIIGLSGKIGSGKTTVGDIFENEGFRLDSFANSVKDICCILFSYNRNKIEGSNPEDRLWREHKDIKTSTIMNRDMSPRDAMVFIGTEFGRNQINDNIWIETLFNRYEQSNNKNLLITDLRFPNEYDEIKKRGGFIIRINRENTNKNNHISECALDNHKFDYIIDNNGTIDDLVIKVFGIINDIEKN